MKPLSYIRGAAVCCAGTILLALTAPAAFAADAAKKATGADSFENTPVNLGSGGSSHATHTASSGIGGSVLRTILALIVVIGVIYGITWIMRHARASKNPTIGNGLERVASLPLAANRSLALVRVGDELHLIGISEHNVTGIRVFNEDEAYELGLPFHSDEDHAGVAGVPLARVVDSLRRMTVR